MVYIKEKDRYYIYSDKLLKVVNGDFKIKTYIVLCRFCSTSKKMISISLLKNKYNMKFLYSNNNLDLVLDKYLNLINESKLKYFKFRGRMFFKYGKIVSNLLIYKNLVMTTSDINLLETYKEWVKYYKLKGILEDV